MPLAKLPSRPALAGSHAAQLLRPALLTLGFCLAAALSEPAAADKAPVATSKAPAATGKEPPWQWQLPPGFPPPVVPAANPMSRAKVALGELLFLDRDLSVNGKLSCSDCHQPANNFVDNVVRPTGALGDTLPFNTPTLWNVAYSTSFSWIDKGFDELEAQHLGPLANADPIELGTGPLQLQALQQKPSIAAALLAAFPDSTMAPLSLDTVAAALASYVRTLIRGGSAFDDYLFSDNRGALNEDAQRGLALFTSERLNCVSCHRGFLLSGPTRSTREAFPPSFYVTGVSNSVDAFRAPSLRFVRYTAPYMHDGSMSTLTEVLDFYEQGGGDPTSSSGEGSHMGGHLTPFELDAAERRSLLAFLESL